MVTHCQAPCEPKKTSGNGDLMEANDILKQAKEMIAAEGEAIIGVADQ